MPCYCRLQNGICCKEGQGGADNQRKQPPRVKHHKDMFRNEDRDMNEGIKEHLNELKSRKRAQLRLPLFPWGWDIETEAGEVQRVGAVIRNCGARLFFPYRGIEGVDTVIDVGTYKVSQERLSPSMMQLNLISSIHSISCRRCWPQSRPASSSHISNILRKVVLLPRSGPGVIDGLVHGPRHSPTRVPPYGSPPLNGLRFLSNFCQFCKFRPKRSRYLPMRSRTRLGDTISNLILRKCGPSSKPSIPTHKAG
jgi:hypothetical protein